MLEESPVVIITGASRGIGAESAIVFAEKGYRVVVSYLSNHKEANKVKDKINSLGQECLLHSGDVADPKVVDVLFKTTLEQFGQVDVLVNNAGVLDTQCRFDEISLERFQNIFQTNVQSCFLCSQQAVKLMSTRHGGKGGSIVNVSSGAAKSGSPFEYVDYAASKGAMDTMTRGLALEVAAEGIRVNGVRPGLIYTDMHADGGEPGRVDRLKEKIPMQRGGNAVEVANAIFWLASEQSSFSTGTFVDVMGGL